MSAKPKHNDEPTPHRALPKGVIVPSSLPGYVGVRHEGVTYLVHPDRVDEFLAAMKAG